MFVKKYGGGQIKKVCLICGDIFELKHPNQRYCSPKCKIIAQKRQIKIRVERYRDKNKDKIHLETKLRKERLYEAIGEAYKEHGSYMNQQHIGKPPTCITFTPNTELEKQKEQLRKEYNRLNLELPEHLKPVTTDS